MRYNVYEEDFFGARNYLNLSEQEINKLIDDLSFLHIESSFYYIVSAALGKAQFQFAIFTNTFNENEIKLWDYCKKNDLYEYYPTVPFGNGGISITPKFLKLFGEECTYEFVKNKILPF